ncbi:hypothetical protein CTAYLR_004200 [Chrysophaeum taylorii]|uniref:Trimethylguanosine synthase n=1 Tax=Chrysophaeum taylorii TaxID=2483200 RepID=A0AAD7UGY8_9STRA|nr:hypothetical protein CTAYLR_004200 [Chrysophaeum taylorii]
MRTEASQVAETERRVESQDRRIEALARCVVLEAASAAVACAADEEQLARLDLRLKLRANELPLQFGKVRRKVRVGDACEVSGRACLVVEDRGSAVVVEWVGYDRRETVAARAVRKTRKKKKTSKYWAQRHNLFSLFDAGVVIPDDESWFSVSPEPIAKATAARCRGKLVVDAFCGCGGNAIQFALAGARVLGIDKDPTKLGAAKHNARIYGADVDLVLGDALALLPNIRSDVVFLSPPWGGPTYPDPFDPQSDIRVGQCDGLGLAALALKAAPNLVLFLPRTVPAALAARFARNLRVWSGELEANLLNNKLKAKTLYLGPLFEVDGVCRNLKKAVN